MGSRIKKIYDKSKTPYQCLIESLLLTAKQKNDLLGRKLRLSPFELKSRLEKKLKDFFEQVRRTDIKKAAVRMKKLTPRSLMTSIYESIRKASSTSTSPYNGLLSA